MDHDEATGGFAFHFEAMPFIERLCHFIDFEDLQSYVPGFPASRSNNGCKKPCPNPIPPMVRMNNDHPYEYLAISILDVGIRDQILLIQCQRNLPGIKVGRKITELPLLIPTPDIRNETTHHQTIQLIDRFPV